MANRNLPVLDGLELFSRTDNKVTYTAFGTFNFESAWKALEAEGAVSCSKFCLGWFSVYDSNKPP